MIQIARISRVIDCGDLQWPFEMHSGNMILFYGYNLSTFGDLNFFRDLQFLRHPVENIRCIYPLIFDDQSIVF